MRVVIGSIAGRELRLDFSIDTSQISAMPLFAGLDRGALKDILSTAMSRRYAAGSPVFEQGQPADHFYVLLHGRLLVTRVDVQGQQSVVRVVNPGDLFGIARALRRPDYPGTATAATDSVALVWPMDHWDSILERNPTFAINAMHTMGQRLQEAHARMHELSTEEVERRVAHMVLRLASQSGRREPDGIRIDFPISKEDIAEMTGTTLHTVSRILSAWQGAGLVETGRQRLLLVDPHRLLLLADGHIRGLL